MSEETDAERSVIESNEVSEREHMWSVGMIYGSSKSSLVRSCIPADECQRKNGLYASNSVSLI